MSLLVIGCGKMGGALVSRWAGNISVPITVVDPQLKITPLGTLLANSPADLAGSKFENILIAVKPQMITDIVPSYLEFFADNACVFSIAAGFSIESLAKVVGQRPIVRMMPNLPAEIGKGVTGYFANPLSNQQNLAFAEELTSAVGTSVPVKKEEDLDKVTAVAGSGTGYAFEIIRCWIAAAESIGLSPESSRDIVLETIGGAVDLASAKTETIETLRNSVTSPNGTTAAGLEQLRKNDAFEELIKSTIDAALARAIELR